MLGPSERAELALLLDTRLQADPEQLPTDLLPAPSLPQARSQAAALMLEIAASLHGNDLTWLLRCWRHSGLEIDRDDLRDLLRNLFQYRVEMRQIVAFGEWAEFCFSADELRLAAPDDRASLGQVVDNRWLLEQRVAAGGVAVVYRARSLVDGAIAAVKIPKRNRSQRSVDTSADRIRTEAELLQRLAGDGIPRLRELLELDFGPVLIMDWIETSGGPGFPVRSSQSEQLQLLARLGRILDRVHQLDFIHGDVKQANILVDRQQRVWLTDFNISRQAAPDQNVDGPLPGTLAMMSQESLVGVAADAGVLQDIYALGVMLYELLTGKPFVRAESREAALVASILKGGVHPPEFPADTSPLLQAICRTATSRHVDRRFATAADFAGTLERFLAGTLAEEFIPPRRYGLIAWQLGTSLGLCLTRVRTMQAGLRECPHLSPTDKLPTAVVNAIGYGMGVALAAEDVQNAAERLGWELPSPPDAEVLRNAAYRAPRLRVADLPPLEVALQQHEQWFREMWRQVTELIAPQFPREALLTTVALQARFAPRSATARDTWLALAEQSFLPASACSMFTAKFSSECSDEEWRVALLQLDYAVGKLLRYELPAEFGPLQLSKDDEVRGMVE